MSANGTDTINNNSIDTSNLSPAERMNIALRNLDLPAEQKEILMKLKSLQCDHVLLEREYRKEWNELKLKYLKRFTPFYEERKRILNDMSPESVDTTSIPGFWLKALQNNLVIGEMIEEHDVPILKHVKNISFSWIDPTEQTSFQIDFEFGPNEYFKNHVLSKTYILERSTHDDDDMVLTRTEGTHIDWYPDKCVTKKTIVRRQRNRRTNQTRTVSQVVQKNSFFNFFISHAIPSREELEEMDSSDVQDLDIIVEAEFDMGSTIRDKIIPHAVGWYLGIERDDVSTDGESEDEPDFEYDEDEDETDDQQGAGPQS